MSNASERLISLDVFRGITIAGMILVNNPGSWGYIYPPLRHATWNGWTPTDLIFPFFLFIVGVAMSISLSKRIERGDTRKQLILKILSRSAIIFAIGFFLNLFPDFDFAKVRIPGVLQRIALCYLFASLIMIYSTKKTQVIWSIAILLFYWIAVKVIPVPGFPIGTLEPQGNLCWYIDSILFKGHTWIYAPAMGFDPEGLFSTIPAISTTLFGIFAGDWLRSNREPNEKLTMLFIFANTGLASGIIMSNWLPINKNLWTSSYTVFTAGIALHFLAMCYWLIDMKGYKKWAKPFLVFGSNAILLYGLSVIVGDLLSLIQIHGSQQSIQEYIYQHWFVTWSGNLIGSLAYAITYIMFWLGILYIFYRKKIFIKI
jgi:predicted acyltransferase